MQLPPEHISDIVHIQGKLRMVRLCWSYQDTAQLFQQQWEWLHKCLPDLVLLNCSITIFVYLENYSKMNLDQGACLLKQTFNNRQMNGFSWENDNRENNRREVGTMGNGKTCIALEKQGRVSMKVDNRYRHTDL